jgi:hypothetical protein
MMGQFLVIDTTNTSTENLEMSSEIKVFPNPCTESFVICHLSIGNTLQVFDIFGRKIIEQRIDKSSNQQIVNISNLSNGIYFLKITSNKKTFNTKFIKQ